jgi:bacillopeptidase F
LIDKKSVDNNGNFVFDYQLTPGDSLIKVRNDNDNKKSDFSPIVTVSYKNAAPNLTIDSPSDGQKFSNDQRDITVSGKTDPGVTVTVNGFWAIIDQNNNYSYNLTLINGDNSIKVDATDQAGNKAEKTIKVNYSE